MRVGCLQTNTIFMLCVHNGEAVRRWRGVSSLLFFWDRFTTRALLNQGGPPMTHPPRLRTPAHPMTPVKSFAKMPKTFSSGASRRVKKLSNPTKQKDVRKGGGVWSEPSTYFGQTPPPPPPPRTNLKQRSPQWSCRGETILCRHVWRMKDAGVRGTYCKPQYPMSSMPKWALAGMTLLTSTGYIFYPGNHHGAQEVLLIRNLLCSRICPSLPVVP